MTANLAARATFAAFNPNADASRVARPLIYYRNPAEGNDATSRHDFALSIHTNEGAEETIGLWGLTESAARACSIGIAETLISDNNAPTQMYLIRRQMRGY